MSALSNISHAVLFGDSGEAHAQVVNNSYYMVYTQHGEPACCLRQSRCLVAGCCKPPLHAVRHEWLASLGIDMEALTQSGRGFALSEMNLKFWRPLRSRQRFRGTAKVARMSAARLVVEQQLLLLPDDTTGRSPDTVGGSAVCLLFCPLWLRVKPLVGCCRLCWMLSAP